MPNPVRWFLPAALLCASCHGPAAVGRDLLDPFNVVVGASTGAGVRVNGAGLFETGLNMGIKPQATALGWKYGRGFALSQPGEGITFDADQTYIIATRSLVGANFADGALKSGRRSFAILPAFITTVDSAKLDPDEWTVPESGLEFGGKEHYLWTARTWRDQRYAMIHAFDLEAEVSIVGYVSLGFSVGEVADLVFSIFGFDLADDDRRGK